MGNETDKIIDAFFSFFFTKIPKKLEESMRGSEFIFKSVDSLNHKIHKISLNRGRYIQILLNG